MAMTREDRINIQKKQYRIDSIKQAFNVVDDTTSGQKDDVADLANKINDILLVLRDIGIIK